MINKMKDLPIEKLVGLAEVPEEYHHAVIGAYLVEACEILKRIERKLDKLVSWERYGD